LHDNKVIGNTEGTDGLFWVDPWSKDGQNVAKRMRPINSAAAPPCRAAIVLIAKARNANPNLREPTRSTPWTSAPAASTSSASSSSCRRDGRRLRAARQSTATLVPPGTESLAPNPPSYALLSDINGVNGRLQDLTYGYSQLRDMFQQQWLRTYRPSNLRPVLERYDFTIVLWLSRIDKARVLQREWSDDHAFAPSAVAALGIPAPPQPVAASPIDIAPKP
jgi:hexosaminidase